MISNLIANYRHSRHKDNISRKGGIGDALLETRRDFDFSKQMGNTMVAPPFYNAYYGINTTELLRFMSCSVACSLFCRGHCKIGEQP